jgi:energy-coupling factor transporter ATP-binding protein EcfA2
LAGPPQPPDPKPKDASVTSGEPLVDMSGLTVELGGKTVLDNVSLRVQAGEVLAVLGPNGGGKTTALHAVLGLVKPARGSISVDGQAVSASAVSRLARRVGLVFQNADHQLVADNVWDEALYASRNFRLLDVDHEREADRLLELAGLSKRTQHHPYRLSWGQKRRLNLISAVLHRPRLLLLDEPFAGQDWENVAFLLDVIRQVLDGTSEPSAGVAQKRGPVRRGACLMVTHDPRIVARSCTRLLFVADGKLALDAPVPQAFDQLRRMGHDAYVPVCSDQPSKGSARPVPPSLAADC